MSKLNTSQVTDMSYMFSYCRGLTTLDVSSFDTSNVVNMSGMFEKCSSLTSLDLSNFNTSKVTDMNNMFSYCKSLTEITVGCNWVINESTDTFSMFDQALVSSVTKVCN